MGDALMLLRTSDSINANLPISLKHYYCFLRQQKLNYLVFIGRLMHSVYILTLILEKQNSYLHHDFNRFHEEGYMKFLVYEIRSILILQMN